MLKKSENRLNPSCSNNEKSKQIIKKKNSNLGLISAINWKMVYTKF